VCVYLQQNKKGRRPRAKNVALKTVRVYLLFFFWEKEGPSVDMDNGKI
jgi:hypothetical protein